MEPGAEAEALPEPMEGEPIEIALGTDIGLDMGQDLGLADDDLAQLAEQLLRLDPADQDDGDGDSPEA